LNLNWKRGLTRCYLVAWAVWLAHLVTRALIIFNPGHLAAELTAISLSGVVVPGLLLLALRWALDGFSPSASD
jgi:hypothetical protein